MPVIFRGLIHFLSSIVLTPWAQILFYAKDVEGRDCVTCQKERTESVVLTKRLISPFETLAVWKVRSFSLEGRRKNS